MAVSKKFTKIEMFPIVIGTGVFKRFGVLDRMHCPGSNRRIQDTLKSLLMRRDAEVGIKLNWG